MPKKKTEDFIPDATKEVAVIPQDLKDQWNAVQAISLTLSLFDHGSYPCKVAHHLPQAMTFLAKLHEKTVEGALEHPQAHMISELKDLKAKKSAVANV